LIGTGNEPVFDMANRRISREFEPHRVRCDGLLINHSQKKPGIGEMPGFKTLDSESDLYSVQI